MPSSQNIAFLAVAVAALVVFAGATYYIENQQTTQAKKKNNNAKSAQKAAEKPKLSKNEVVKIIETITSQMNQVVIQLARIEQNLRKEVAQSGRSIPEAQLASYLLGQFEDAMKTVEAMVFEKFKCSEEELQAASLYYTDEQEVKDAITKLKNLYNVVIGQPPTVDETIELPADLTVTKVIKVMEETMEAMSTAMEETCEEARAKGTVSSEEIQLIINQEYVKRAEEISAEVPAKHGITREQLQVAMAKFQDNPQFLERMSELQQEQAARFSAAAKTLELDLPVDDL